MTTARPAPPRPTTAALKVPYRRPALLERIGEHPAGIVAACWVLLLALLCLLAPVIAPYGYNDQDLGNVLAGPSAAHWLGTDPLGRDILSRLLYGGTDAFVGIVQVTLVAVLVGLPTGIAAGYLKGAFDAVSSRLADIILALPSLIILLLLFAIDPSARTAAMITLGLLFSPSLFRIARAMSLQASQELYVRFAEVSRVRKGLIMLRHILPTALPPVVVNLSLMAAFALIIQSGLAFLNFGVLPPQASWGGMLQDAQMVISEAAWMMVPPAVAIGSLVVCFITIGDAARDIVAAATTPRRRSRRGESLEVTVGSVDAEESIVVAPSPTALLRVRGLGLSRAASGTEPAAPLVTDLGFELQPGESIGIVGESGCGKSVTTLALLGLLPANITVDRGEVVFDGEDLTTASKSRMQQLRGRRIGYVSQDPMVGLDPCYKVSNQMIETIRRHSDLSKSAARARAIELLRSVQLHEPERVMSRYPHELSGGMAQRVCIALALAGDPDVLIADEPTTSLDVTVQHGILQLLEQIKREKGLSLILITHDLNIVPALCDKLLVLYAGDVVEHGPTLDVVTRPRHPYTRRLLDCGLHGVERGEPFPLIEGTVPHPGTWPDGCRFRARCGLATAACAEPGSRAVRRDGAVIARCITVREGASETAALVGAVRTIARPVSVIGDDPNAEEADRG